jgi:hypothetical protein
MPVCARLGESVAECNKRYGDPVFSHTKDKLSFRTYNFSGRKIRVLFFDGKSAIEQITEGPEIVFMQDLANEATQKSIRFVRGLLGQAYGFTEKELEGLANLRRTSPDEAQANIQNETTIVNYSMQADEDQGSAKFVTLIMSKPVIAEHGKTMGFGQFMSDCVALELKKDEVNDAEGF